LDEQLLFRVNQLPADNKVDGELQKEPKKHLLRNLTEAEIDSLHSVSRGSTFLSLCLCMRCYVFQRMSQNTSVQSLLDLFFALAYDSVQQHIRELVRQSAMHVMNSGGVVRKINSWGTLALPQKMKRNGPLQNVGEWVEWHYPCLSCLTPHLYSYWTLHFDASPRTLRSLNGIMRRDPRVLRWTVLKLADTLEDLAKQGQKMHISAKSYVSVNAIID
jgi:small subunit ribosomal protein S6